MEIKTGSGGTDSDGAGSRAWRESLKRNQYRVRGGVGYAARNCPLETEFAELAWEVAVDDFGRSLARVDAVTFWDSSAHRIREITTDITFSHGSPPALPQSQCQ